jgi:hypothetical protein
MAEPTVATDRSAVRRAFAWGASCACLTILGIYFGSRGLRDFDSALVAYAGASVFSAFGLGYRHGMWLSRPPTRLYWRRGWRLFFERFFRNLPTLLGLAWANIVAQRFIEKRSRLRWLAHLFIAWGCILAASVTFPLSFGWVRFESEPASPLTYVAFLFGVRLFHFESDGMLAPLVFNVLDIAAFMVLIGIGLSLWRRARDRGALAVQQLANDLLPLVLLFAVSVTGLLLTFSTHAMRGVHYAFLSELHAVTVIVTLVYLPFGKFFHVFQRPAQLSIKFYKESGARSGPVRCLRCDAPFATQMHLSDLKDVEAQLGIRFQTSSGHYQDVCPSCRRKLLALAQDGLWHSARTPRV